MMHITGRWGSIKGIQNQITKPIADKDTILTDPPQMDLEAQLHMSDSRPIVAMFQNQEGWRPDFLSRLMTVEDIAGTARVAMANERVVIPHAQATSENIEVEAKGVISRESGAVGDGQTGRLLFARLGDAPGFWPGDFVAVRIDEPPLDRVVRLPATAVDAGGTVLVLGEEDRLEVGDVEVLRRERDDVIVRARGLAGREIVSERTPLLGAGIRIRPIRPDGAPEPEGPEMLSLDSERRARLVAFVEGNAFMPDEAKARVLAQLREDQVPARVVERIESRMGG